MKIITSLQAKDLDAKAIAGGIDPLTLMENAAQEVAKSSNFLNAKKVLIIAGKGNNGGDGVAIARILKENGINTEIYLIPTKKGSKQRSHQVKIAKKAGVKFIEKLSFRGVDIIVDAIYGIGFKPPISDEVRTIINKVNNSGSKIISIDIPSGLSGNNGEIPGPHINSNITFTFSCLKYAHVLYPAKKYCGEIQVLDIGIPPKLEDKIECTLLDQRNLTIKKRELDTHKFKEGHVLLIGGSTGKTGAIILAAKAANRSGAGLVSVGVSKALNSIYESNLIEEMTIPIQNDKKGLISINGYYQLKSGLKDYSSVLIGPGMGIYEKGAKIVIDLMKSLKEKPLIIDADGLNNISEYIPKEQFNAAFKNKKCEIILTPHIGEFSRLFKIKKDEIEANQIELTKTYSKKLKCYIVLKGATTVIGCPNGKAIVSTLGTPSLATAGSGDVLAGAITALAGNNYNILDAIQIGVATHAISGQLAAKKHGEVGVIASDLIDNLIIK